MLSKILKLAVLGGVGYLLYKHFYLNKKDDVYKNTDSKNEKDERTLYYGDTKDEYVRGFPMPNNINDLKANKIWVITKPKQSVFGEPERAMIQLDVFKDTNRLVYNNENYVIKNPYVADYDKVKDKIVMNEKYTK
jgi:hypothetical protein